MIQGTTGYVLAQEGAGQMLPSSRTHGRLSAQTSAGALRKSHYASAHAMQDGSGVKK